MHLRLRTLNFIKKRKMNYLKIYLYGLFLIGYNLLTLPLKAQLILEKKKQAKGIRFK